MALHPKPETPRPTPCNPRSLESGMPEVASAFLDAERAEPRDLPRGALTRLAIHRVHNAQAGLPDANGLSCTA